MPHEPTSTEKALVYSESYKNAIASQKKQCLGSYVFLWGQKQEVTPTWYGIFLASGERLESFDVMTQAWSGAWPEDRCPSVKTVNWGLGKTSILPPGAKVHAVASVNDPDGDPIFLRWEVRSESRDRHEGGDRESEPAPHPECRMRASGKELDIELPRREGAYRLFMYAYDGRGSAGTANAPFLIKKP